MDTELTELVTSTTTGTTEGRSKLSSHGKSNEMGHPQGEGRDDAEMGHHYSQYKGGNRKYSFQLPEDSEEPRFHPIIHQSFENSNFLRKRKASSD